VYRWIDHTAEVELAIEAGDEREVFADALRALAELIEADEPASHPPEQRTLELTASDRPALLAAWLEELVYLLDTEGFVASDVIAFELTGHALRATVVGAVDQPAPLVKAATYHRLEFRRHQDGYVATVVLDV
jgi:SHS2 domain-containing protein